MRVLVIDGQGGGIGKAIVAQLKKEIAGCEIIAVGTNSIATSAMLKAGADAAATGENAVIFNSGDVDYIAGVIGIAFANSMYGEITPAMAAAVSASRARKIFVPLSSCGVVVAGVTEKPLSAYIAEMIEIIRG